MVSSPIQKRGYAQRALHRPLASAAAMSSNPSAVVRLRAGSHPRLASLNESVLGRFVTEGAT
jgi:hypothetical protein